MERAQSLSCLSQFFLISRFLSMVRNRTWAVSSSFPQLNDTAFPAHSTVTLENYKQESGEKWVGTKTRKNCPASSSSILSLTLVFVSIFNFIHYQECIVISHGLIYIFLESNHFEHLFICLLVIHIFSFEEQILILLKANLSF